MRGTGGACTVEACAVIGVVDGGLELLEHVASGSRVIMGCETNPELTVCDTSKSHVDVDTSF